MAVAFPRFPTFLIALITVIAITVGLHNMDRLSQQLSSLNKQLEYTARQLATVGEEELLQHMEKNMRAREEEGKAVSEALWKEKVERLERENQLLKTQLAHEVDFLPLKNLTPCPKSEDHIFYYFMSTFKGRGFVEGPPELFTFPSNLSRHLLLCLKGNHTSLGEKNSYGFAPRHHLPFGSSFIPGLTFISDSSWSFMNPWHAMYNLLQFVYWRLENQCASGNNLLLFHKSEFRFHLGEWAASLLHVTNLPSSALVPKEARDSCHQGENVMCFEKAVVSRNGLGGMTRELRRRTFDEARCQARRACNVHMDNPNSSHVNITLLVRNGSRSFLHEEAWRQVVKEECEATPNCTWSTINLGSLTFCQQVEAMSYTNILMSIHGAQLSNLIFMSPGSKVMELLPKGWLEFAGQGQYIYKQLADWIGLRHEGYWRDPTPAPCPKSHNLPMCFRIYKDLQLAKINASEISSWLSKVIIDYKNVAINFASNSSARNAHPSPHLSKCKCPPTILNS